MNAERTETMPAQDMVSLLLSNIDKQVIVQSKYGWQSAGVVKSVEVPDNNDLREKPEPLLIFTTDGVNQQTQRQLELVQVIRVSDILAAIFPVERALVVPKPNHKLSLV